MTDAWPTEIRASNEGRVLNISFDDRKSFALPAELLRVESPSAEVRGHSPAERKTVGGKINVRIKAIEPVGNYAVKLVFDDGHDTGLYTWSGLHKLGAEQSSIWAEYLSALATKGLARDKPGQK